MRNRFLAFGIAAALSLTALAGTAYAGGTATSTMTSDTSVSPSTGLKTGGGNNAGLFLQTKTCNNADSACGTDPFNPSTRPPNVKTETLYFSKQVLLPSGASIAKVPSCNLVLLAAAASTKGAVTACSASAIGQGQANACFGASVGNACTSNRTADVSVFKLANTSGSPGNPQLAFYADLSSGSSPAMGGNPLLIGTIQSVPKGPLTTAGYAKQLVIQVPNTSGLSLTAISTNLAFASLIKLNCSPDPATSGVIKYSATFEYWQSYTDDSNSRTQSCSTA